MPIDETNTSGVEERLDVAVRLLAALLTKDMTRKDAILTLSGVGLAPKEVGRILGVSANSVSVALYDAKQAAAKKPPSKKV